MISPLVERADCATELISCRMMTTRFPLALLMLKNEQGGLKVRTPSQN
jgi:hypothetical protein